jgi:uncharacterized membrane protein YfcA
MKNVLLSVTISAVIAYAAVLYIANEGLLGSMDSTLFEYGRQLLEQTVENLSHKDLFPMDSTDWWGTITVTLGLLIAAAGGIGGGGILVPLYILVMGFRPKYAVALSNFTIVGSSITNILMNLPKRHPHADRPLVDWDLILVMEPLTMAGAIVGAFLSKILPDWILVISLVFLLAFTTYTTLEKGFQQFNKETRQFAEERKSVLTKTLEKDDDDSESLPLLAESAQEAHKDRLVNVSHVDVTEHGDGTHNSEVDNKDPESNFEDRDEKTVNRKESKTSHSFFASRIGEASEELDALLEEERHTPYDKVVMVSVMIGVVIILNLLKGGGAKFSSPLGFECGGNSYWFVTTLVFAWILGFSWYMRDILVQKWNKKLSLRYRYVEGDVEWNPVNTLIYPAICFFAGFFAGLFGIGGGIVKGPLMLYMGVHPQVASATCAVMIMFTSLAGTTMYIAFGTLLWDYGLFFFTLGLAATCVGQYGVSYLVQKYRRVSLVSLSIGAVVALSTILMAIQSIFSLIDYENRPQKSTLCGE